MRKFRKDIQGNLVASNDDSGLPVWLVKVDDNSVNFNGETLLVQTFHREYVDGFTFAPGMKVGFLVAPFGAENKWCAIEVRPIQTSGSVDSGLLKFPEEQRTRDFPKRISFLISKERNSFYVDYFEGDDRDQAVTWLYENYPNRKFIFLQGFTPEDNNETIAYEALIALLKIKTDEDGSLGHVVQIVLAKLFECGVVHIRRKFEDFYSR